MKSILAESKIVFAALTFSIVSFCFTGCQKEESTSFTATTQSYQAPKLHITSNFAYWDDGDQVDINNGTYSVSVDGSSNNKATIAADGVTAYGGEYYAAYPASYADIATNGTIVFDLPSKEAYTTTASGNQNTHNLMVAKANNSHLAFQNVGAMLHFQLKGSESGIGQKLVAIEVSTDKPLCGKLTVTPSGSNWSTSLSSTASDTARILTFSNHTITNTAEDFYIFIPEVINATHFRLQYVIESGNTVKVFDAIKFATTDFLKEHIYHFGENEYDGNKIKISNTRDIYPLHMDGSEAHPYLISSNTLWQASSSHLATANNYVTLVNDITVDTRITNLKAHLNGNGHTITLNSNSISLFENIDGGSVSNLTIEGNITAPTCSNVHYGSLACNLSNSATIDNCINKVNIECLQGKQLGSAVGGLCGYLGDNCSITNCLNQGTILSDALSTGGVAGYCNGVATVNNCKNEKSITINIATNENQDVKVGGVFGFVSLKSTDGTISANNCQNSGSITISGNTTNVYCGGVFGHISSSTTFNVENCINTGNITYNSDITRTRYLGGIAGTDGSNPSTMINCYNEGSISAECSCYAGGLLGNNWRMSIKNCYAYCNISINTTSPKSTAAGLAVYGVSLYSSATISNCYYYGSITAYTVYGIAGQSNAQSSMSLDHCYYPSGLTICGTNTHADNTCGTITDPNSSTLLNNLTNNTPSGGKSWQLGSSHIIFQNP